MKKYLIFILLLFFVSCSMIMPDKEWYELGSIPNELKSMTNADIYNWVVCNIEYKNYANGFHSAQRTFDEKEGNCANMALLELALLYKIKGIKGKLVYCQKTDYSLHYTVNINNYYLEKRVIFKIYEEIEFDNIADYIFYRQ